MEGGSGDRSAETWRRSSESAENERLTSEDSLEMDDYLHSDDAEEEEGLAHKRPGRRKPVDGHIDGQDSARADAAAAEKKQLNATMMKNITINALLIALWYSFSIAISVYNKWMFSKENLDFHYPLFVTSIHMLVQFSLASTVLYFMPRFRPSADPAANPHHPSYRQLDGEEQTPQVIEPPAKKEPLMTKTFYATRIGPCGTATALDIGLGNFSLRFISLTFYTMCKSSVLAFVLLFAFLFHLESPTWKLCLIIAFMTVGVIMMVAGEAAFNALGFVLVMTASVCAGFRWSLTQILLMRNPATSNPFSSIFFLTPIMFFALFILALPIEGPGNVIEGIRELATNHGGFLSFLLLLFPGLLAFLMVSAEFALLQRTSVVTLSVCGIFKEVLTISAASLAFGDELSPINVSGLVVTILSIAAYNVLKYSKVKKETQKELHARVVEEQESPSRPLKAERDPDESGIDSTSALLRRDSEQFALAEDDDEPNDGGRSSTANGVLGNGVLDKTDLVR
jgi:solute carrier family 35, member C2